MGLDEGETLLMALLLTLQVDVPGKAPRQLRQDAALNRAKIGWNPSPKLLQGRHQPIW